MTRSWCTKVHRPTPWAGSSSENPSRGRLASALLRRLAMKKPILVAAFLFAAGARAQTYTAIDLGTLGGNSTIVAALNESGLATGRSTTSAGVVHAFRYSGGPLLDLTPNSTVT